MRKTVIGSSIALAMALAPAAVLAQDDMAEDMDDGDMMMGSMVPHPSHIHAGDCSNVGDVVVALSDVGVVGNDAMGAEAHVHVDLGQTTVELGLSDILAADHSIVVHNSADDMGTWIACGAIGGHEVDDSFLVGLGAVGDSGWSGIAWLTDNGDGTTDVTVTISNSGATEGAGMNDATDDMSDVMDDDSMDDDMSDDMDDDSMDDDMEDDDMSEDG